MSTSSKTNFCGIDFGTTNSSLAVIKNNLPQTVLLDSGSHNQQILKSLIYINPNHQPSLGSQATAKYLHDLEHFPSKPPRLEFTGRYIKTFGPSTGGGAGPPIFVPEIVEVDDSGRGRLLQSLKSVLTSDSFTGTNIFGKFYSLEELLTILLKEIKEQAERQLGYKLESVLLGRPVKYVGTGKEATALKRMRQIATNSGFKNIEFEYEPIGAALNYGLNINTSQKILVFDFGGGTLDVCVMKLPEKEILSVSGIPIGGDLLNSKIVEHKLYPHFGSESLINGKMTFPRHFLHSLSSWYESTMLKNVKDVAALENLVIKSNQPDKVSNLLNLVVNDYSFDFFRNVDKTKIQLSNSDQTTFKINRPKLSITQDLSRSDFEKAIQEELQSTKDCLNTVLKLASLNANDIDKVILTGGSSQVPAFKRLLSKIFPSDKLIGSNYFTAVALGLAIRAEQIFDKS